MKNLGKDFNENIADVAADVIVYVIWGEAVFQPLKRLFPGCKEIL
jgi:hypothetical protein